MLFNAATYLLTRNLEEGRGDHVAVRTPTASLTYCELDALCGDVAAAYRTAGLRRDDRVLMVMSDDVPMMAAILGAFRAGVVAVPVSTMLTGAELGTIMADSGARLVVCTSEFTEPVAAALLVAADVEEVVLVGEGALAAPPAVAVSAWDAFAAAGEGAGAAQHEVAVTDEDAWALWLYTSGTTGTPKAAMHRHANIRHVCETYGHQVLGIRPEDTTFSVAKLFFAYGIGNSLFFPFSVGATTVLEPRRPTPDLVAERVVAERPTLFFGVPTFYAALLASTIPDDTFASVRLAASAGEALPAPLLRRFEQRFGVDIIDGIGSTEALHIFVSNAPGDIRPGTTGVAVPGYEVTIKDEDGRDAAPGTPGALHVRGASIALGYWRRTDASRQVFRGEWLVTGDTYVQDADGYFTCLGRNNDMLKAGGIWVSPAEVESRLLEHPAVQEAAVVGVADSDGLDKPVGVVVLVAGAHVLEADLIGWCRDGLAHFKAPRHVVLVDELPKTATGKLQRFKVRALLAQAENLDPHDLGTDDLTASAPSL
ncbi:benzoate-CoA ligase family protein [Nocardioides mangrovicus]|uniref:Benzoate-CoA ligase family protein n=1 Tax=Nocardioides mangrovicus TaxID=2478913 RepID=A0A3L8NXP3_9ACTN|nr:benzoate-CoA ligase family protein [Nocardioides mangrovicus]RLV47955.1 benzoate-CoA ligase family protein [Nocardioides mangrovicus]